VFVAFLTFLAFAAFFGWILHIRLVRRKLAWDPTDHRHNDRDWNPVVSWSMNVPLVGAILVFLGGALLCLTDMIGLTEFFSESERQRGNMRNA